MEKLDSSVQPELTTGIYDSANARKTLMRCTCWNAPSKQPCSLSEKLGSCMGDSSWLPAVIKPLAAGTGVYFRNGLSNCALNYDGNTSELQDLFNLATVACEVESTSVKSCQFVKKRRTPRNIFWINGSRFANGNSSTEISPGATTCAAKRIEKLNLHSPLWLEKSALSLESSGHAKLNEGIHRSSYKVRQQQNIAEKTMEYQPARSVIKFNWLSKGSRLPPKCTTKLWRPKACASRFPGKETRVQGFAKRILQFVGEGSTAEKFIRRALGNNPDTSKALRLLLKQHKVNRVGDGGRGKAFLYVVTPAGLKELQELNNKLDTEDFMIQLCPTRAQDSRIKLGATIYQ